MMAYAEVPNLRVLFGFNGAIKMCKLPSEGPFMLCKLSTRTEPSICPLHSFLPHLCAFLECLQIRIGWLKGSDTARNSWGRCGLMCPDIKKKEAEKWSPPTSGLDEPNNLQLLPLCICFVHYHNHFQPSPHLLWSKCLKTHCWCVDVGVKDVWIRVRAGKGWAVYRQTLLWNSLEGYFPL